MSMLDRMYKQDITYWGVASLDTFQKATFNAPVVFKGRWEDKVIEVMGNRGEVFTSNAVVHYPETLTVETTGYMYNGISNALDPREVVGASRVQGLQSQPDLRLLETVKVALL